LFRVEVETQLGGETVSSSTIIPTKAQKKLDLQFFPEGGEMIEGIESKIAFKALNSWGTPENIEGVIIDSNGNKVTKITSTYMGMGTFRFQPEKGKNYKFQITPPPFKGKVFDLPTARKDGLILEVLYVTKEVIGVRIKSSKKTKEQIHLLAHKNEKAWWGLSAKIEGEGLVRIPTKDFPMGIINLTLFNEKHIPVAERLVFANSQKKLQISVTTDKKEYLPREKVRALISVKNHLGDPMPANLSMSVTDPLLAKSLRVRSKNILETFQIQGELKGRVPYLGGLSLDNQNLEKIDYLLLTHGWRRYKAQNDIKQETLTLPSSQEFIKGKIEFKNERNQKPLEVNLMNLRKNTFFTTLSDSSGIFTFDKELLGIEPSLAIIFPSASNQNKTKITLFEEERSPYYQTAITKIKEEAEIKPMEMNYTSNGLRKKRNTAFSELSHYKLLEQVVIEADSIKEKDPIAKQFYGSAVHSKSGKELKPSVDLIGLIRQVSSIRYHDPVKRAIYFNSRGLSSSLTSPPNPALFIVNNTIMGSDYTLIGNLSPEDIEFLTVVRGSSPRFLYGQKAESGVVFITTTEGYKEELPMKKGPDYLAIVENFREKREFYQPKYDTDSAKEILIPDLRATIHWEPNIEIDSTGQKVIEFYNADRKTTIEGLIEGFNNSGLLGALKFNYKVDSTN
ncbi:TonB-dependent receptor, partial [Xanthovirga aplysinae]|uniref:TonB-dependent receptor n=1 Tax=Xanthovirga aplysinae TaxID=2529853 RepID=UPI0012BBF3FB